MTIGLSVIIITQEQSTRPEMMRKDGTPMRHQQGMSGVVETVLIKDFFMTEETEVKEKKKVQFFLLLNLDLFLLRNLQLF